MRRHLFTCVLLLALLGTGCASWNVDAFGVPVGRPAPRTLGHHAALEWDSLDKDEKTATIVTVTVAVLSVTAYLIWGD